MSRSVATPHPTAGERITHGPDGLRVPAQPIIPFIRGDGVGPEIWRAAEPVFDAAVERAYGRMRRVAWMEVYAGDAAYRRVGSWLPDETIAAFRTYRIGLRGPLSAPTDGAIRSLNVAFRQILDLYACKRPVRYLSGIPSPITRSATVGSAMSWPPLQ